MNTYFREPGIVSKAKRRCCKGSLVRSREFIGDDRNLAGKNDDSADIFSGLFYPVQRNREQCRSPSTVEEHRL